MVKSGLMYGGVSILITLGAYLSDPKSMMDLSNWSSILGYVVGITFMYLAAKKARDKKGGFIPFGEALVPSLVTYAIGMFIGVLFTYLLINYLDPSIKPIIQEGAKEMLESTYSTMGLSEEQILIAMEEVERQQEGQDQFGILPSLLGWLMSILIPGLPIAAIIAAIVKKKEPMPIV